MIFDTDSNTANLTYRAPKAPRQRPLPLPGNLEISLLSRFGTLAISRETFTVLRDGVGRDTRRLQPPVERDLLVHL